MISKYIKEAVGEKKELLQSISDEVLYQDLVCFDDMLDCTKSPIESKLLTALIVSNSCGMRIQAEDNGMSWGDTNFCLIVNIQKKIGRYNVDFLIEEKDIWKEDKKIPVKKLIVECDGHDFHEKTKEQVSRDKRRERNLQAMGFPIYRFSGSEIYKSPTKCAESINDYFKDKPKQCAM